MDDVPVGFIAPYAGELNTVNLMDLFKNGWMPCDGTMLKPDTYKELYSVIGKNFGWQENTSTGEMVGFFLPTLNTSTFVRGVTYDAPEPMRDPDAGGRIFWPPSDPGHQGKHGGNPGNEIGSYQPAGTALPKTPFELTTDGDHSHRAGPLTDKTHDAYKGTNFDVCEENPDGAEVSDAGDHQHVISGGDRETMPVNMAVNWIIKVTGGVGS